MLIVGCGAVGTKIAAMARDAGDEVRAVVRSTRSADALREQGIAAGAIDLDRPLERLPTGQQPTRIYYLVPPPGDGIDDPRMRHFLTALPHDANARIVYISTTGVYGDCGGEWVDETRAPNPGVDRARRRLDAENQLRAWREKSAGEVVILRVAGIYGPGKLPLERLHRRAPMVGEDEAPWTNRIHIDDLASVCVAAMARGRDGGVYNVSDGAPGNMRDYFDRVADLHGLPRAPLLRLDEADGQLSPGLLSYLAESRRLDNRKMLDELGVTLRYPTLAEGLASCALDAAMEK